MSSIQRRDFLTGAAAFAAGVTAALAGTRRAAAGDPKTGQRPKENPSGADHPHGAIPGTGSRSSCFAGDCEYRRALVASQ
jgi:hypothetical protein